jgi:hypothetical protein
VCIGAQKAGTSTLFRLLEPHPDIRVPPSKEDPIFHRPVTPAEVDDYLRSRFGGVAEEVRCGTVTPQYMFGPDIAERVFTHAPTARVVALLRDPVERAFSHHRMNIRRGLDRRSFPEAAIRQVHQLRSGVVPDIYDERETLVWRGCYSDILEPWIDLFGPSNVLVVFTDELDRDQGAVLARVQDHIGVARLPAPSEDVYEHAAPPAHQLSGLRRPVAAALRRVGLLDLVSEERRVRIADGLEHLLARAAPAEAPRIDPDTEALLHSFFRVDRVRLTDLLGQEPPW